MFSEANEKKLDKIITRYPVKRSAILPALYIAQEEHGYVTDDDVKYIAGRLDMRVNEVEEVVTFYTMYSRKPIGKYKLYGHRFERRMHGYCLRFRNSESITDSKSRN